MFSINLQDLSGFVVIFIVVSVVADIVVDVDVVVVNVDVDVVVVDVVVVDVVVVDVVVVVNCNMVSVQSPSVSKVFDVVETDAGKSLSIVITTKDVVIVIAPATTKNIRMPFVKRTPFPGTTRTPEQQSKIAPAA